MIYIIYNPFGDNVVVQKENLLHNNFNLQMDFQLLFFGNLYLITRGFSYYLALQSLYTRF